MFASLSTVITVWEISLFRGSLCSLSNPVAINITNDFAVNGQCYSCLSNNVTDNPACSSGLPSGVGLKTCLTKAEDRSDNPTVCFTRSRPFDYAANYKTDLSPQPFFERDCTDADTFGFYLDDGVIFTSGCRIVHDPMVPNPLNPDPNATLVLCVCSTSKCNMEPPQDVKVYTNPYTSGVAATSVLNIQPSQVQIAQVLAVQGQTGFTVGPGLAAVIAQNSSVRATTLMTSNSNAANNSMLDGNSTGTGGTSIVKCSVVLHSSVIILIAYLLYIC